MNFHHEGSGAYFGVNGCSSGHNIFSYEAGDTSKLFDLTNTSGGEENWKLTGMTSEWMSTGSDAVWFMGSTETSDGIRNWIIYMLNKVASGA